MKIVYSKENCPACDRLKSQLKVNNEDFKEVLIGRDITREEFLQKYPNVRSVPYVVLE